MDSARRLFLRASRILLPFPFDSIATAYNFCWLQDKTILFVNLGLWLNKPFASVARFWFRGEWFLLPNTPFSASLLTALLLCEWVVSKFQRAQLGKSSKWTGKVRRIFIPYFVGHIDHFEERVFERNHGGLQPRQANEYGIVLLYDCRWCFNVSGQPFGMI